MAHWTSKLAATAAMASMLAAGPLAKPASASTGSTLTTIAGALALIGGIVLYNNYEHKKQAANSVVGYTRNGGTVYGDGRIVMPNGQTIYPNANGQYPWGQTAYYRPNANGYTYDPDRTGRYDATHRHGTYRANYVQRERYAQRERDEERAERARDEDRYRDARQYRRAEKGHHGHGKAHSHGHKDHDD